MSATWLKSVQQVSSSKHIFGTNHTLFKQRIYILEYKSRVPFNPSETDVNRFSVNPFWSSPFLLSVRQIHKWLMFTCFGIYEYIGFLLFNWVFDIQINRLFWIVLRNEYKFKLLFVLHWDKFENLIWLYVYIPVHCVVCYELCSTEFRFKKCVCYWLICGIHFIHKK